MMTGIRCPRYMVRLAALLGALLLSVPLFAQPTGQRSQQPGQDSQQSQPQQPRQPQQPGQTPDQSGQQSPDAQATPQGGQTFVGVIAKSGDKYVLQEADSGTTYDIDHQDEVKKFEGKRVRVHGTLDPNGKMIHIQ